MSADAAAQPPATQKEQRSSDASTTVAVRRMDDADVPTGEAVSAGGTMIAVDTASAAASALSALSQAGRQTEPTEPLPVDDDVSDVSSVGEPAAVRLIDGLLDGDDDSNSLDDSNDAGERDRLMDSESAHGTPAAQQQSPADLNYDRPEMLGAPPDVSAAALLSLQQMEARVSSTVLRISGNVDETAERPGQHAADSRGEPASGTGNPRNLRKLSLVFCSSVSALEWIHRRQLWTQEFHSFSQYARERWQITRQRLYQIIKCKSVLNMITHEIKPYSTALCTEVGRLRERFGATVADRVWTAAVEKNKLDGRRISVSTLRTSSEIPGAAGPELDGHGNGNSSTTTTAGKARRPSASASAARPVGNGDAVDAKSSPAPKPRRATAGSAKARSGPAAGRAAVSPSSKAPTGLANGNSRSQAAKTVSASSSTMTAAAATPAAAVAAATAVTTAAAATTTSAFVRPQAHAAAAVNGGSGARWPAVAVETTPAWMFASSVPMQPMQPMQQMPPMQSNVWNTVYPRQPATAVQPFAAPPFTPSSTVTTAPVHPEVIARACAAIGGAFDVDVNVPRARVSEESGAVQARTRYTGLAALSQPWTGNVWGNLVCVPDLSVFAVGESASATGGEGPVGGRRPLEIEPAGSPLSPRGRRAEEDEFVSTFLMSARRRFAVGEFSHAIFLAPYRPAATWWSLVADAPHACLVVHPFWPPLPERITDVFVVILLTRGPVTIVNRFCHTFGSIGYIPGMSTAHVAAHPQQVAPQQ